MLNETKNSTSSVFNTLVGKMKADKKFELAVYGILIMVGVLIFAFSSCDGLTNAKNAGASPDSKAQSADDVERRLEDILSSIDGAGEVKVMIVRDDAGIICGAIVTAEGASSISVCEKLRNAVKTVLGIDLSQVEIFRMQSNNTEG